MRSLGKIAILILGSALFFPGLVKAQTLSFTGCRRSRC